MRVRITKFFGVLVDESLNWKLLEYRSMYMLYLLYCVEIWGNTYSTNLQRVIML